MIMHCNVDKIKRHLKRNLDSDRYEHTIGVSYVAVAMAMRYGYDIKKAMLAGLLHDCAKCIPSEKMLKKCAKYNISITEAEKNNPDLLHAKLGAFLAMHKYRMDNKDIINAILYHTTGRPAMSMLEKIIFIADYIEPIRNKAPRLKEIRQTAFSDLDMTMYMILKDTLDYLDELPKETDQTTVKAFEYYEHIETERVKKSSKTYESTEEIF
jgi:predicted HD superfamily hydrolase involved in NAD metabolism